jgi:hypothetical protein
MWNECGLWYGCVLFSHFFFFPKEAAAACKTKRKIVYTEVSLRIGSEGIETGLSTVETLEVNFFGGQSQGSLIIHFVTDA